MVLKYHVRLAPDRLGFNPQPFSNLGRIPGEIQQLFMHFIFHFFIGSTITAQPLWAE